MAIEIRERKDFNAAFLQFSNTVYIALLQGSPDQATIEQAGIKNRITNGSGNFCR